MDKEIYCPRCNRSDQVQFLAKAEVPATVAGGAAGAATGYLGATRRRGKSWCSDH